MEAGSCHDVSRWADNDLLTIACDVAFMKSVETVCTYRVPSQISLWSRMRPVVYKTALHRVSCYNHQIEEYYTMRPPALLIHFSELCSLVIATPAFEGTKELQYRIIECSWLVHV